MVPRDAALDGLRGLAAIIVALCHFVLAFQPGFLSGDASHGGWVAAHLARTPAILLWNPEFGVAVFFVLSGVVLASSTSTTYLGLPTLVLRRWLRLSLPILGSSMLIWIVVEAGLLRNAEVARANGSAWLAGQFGWLAWQKNDLWQVVRQSLFDVFASGTQWWNQALWTMRTEFIGSIGVYLSVLALRRLRFAEVFLLLAGVAGIGVFHGTPYAQFAAGVALQAARRVCTGRSLARIARAGGLALAAAAVLAGGMPWAISGGGPYWTIFVRLSAVLSDPIPAVHASGAVLAVAAVLVWSPARRLLSLGAAAFLGRISFMLYLCHIILLCTVASWIVIAAAPRVGYDAATGLALVGYFGTLLPLSSAMTFVCDGPAIRASRLVGPAAVTSARQFVLAHLGWSPNRSAATGPLPPSGVLDATNTGSSRRLGGKVSRILTLWYVALALVATGVLAMAVPPYQNPDELNHFLRAEQISRLGLLPRQLPVGLAGDIPDSGMAATAAPLSAISSPAMVKASRSLLDSVRLIPWGIGTAPVLFPNTSLYPPVFYIPAAITIWVGKAAQISIVHTLYLARLVNGICSTAIAATAILLAEAAAVWLFTVLALPMTLALFASASQDGLLIASSALAAALLVAGFRHGMSSRRFIALCLSLAAICAARPPYLPFALLPLIAAWRTPKDRVCACGIVIAVVLAWCATVTLTVGVHLATFDQTIDPAAQLLTLARSPLSWFGIIRDTVAVDSGYWLEAVVGTMGTYDVRLPPTYHHLAWAALAAAACCSVIGGASAGPAERSRVGFVAVLIAAAVMSVLFIQYLTWTPVGNPLVHGIQGRYFLPPLLFASCILSRGQLGRQFWSAPLWLFVLLFPVVSLVVTIRAVIFRYYLV